MRGGIFRKIVILSFFVWVFFGLPSDASASDYYIEKVSDTTWRYEENAWPTVSSTECSLNNIQGCMNDLDGGSHTIIIHPGTYSGTDLHSTTNLQTNDTNTTLRGPVSGDNDYSNHTGTVTIDGSTYVDDVIYVNRTGWVISNLTLTGATSTKYALNASTVSTTASDLDIVLNTRAMYVKDGTFSRIRVRSTSVSPYYVVAVFGTGSDKTIWNDCIFENNAGPFTIGSVVEIEFNNCIFAGFHDRAVAATASGVTATFNNCIFVANMLYTFVNEYVIRTLNAGTWNFNNCIMGSTIRGSSFTDDTGGATINITNDISSTHIPKFAQQKRDSRLIFFIDDTTNLDFWYDVADLAETYGYTMVFSMYKADSGSVDWEKLSGYIESGHEVASHGVSNARLDSNNALTVTHSTATVTVSIDSSDPSSDNWTGTMSFSTGESIDLASAEYDTLGEVQTYINGLSGYSAALPAGQTNITEARSVTLANITNQSLAGGYILQFNQTNLFYVEMYETKGWLESMIQPYIPSWTAKSFVYAGGNAGTDAKTYALGTAGYSQARTAYLTSKPSVVDYDMSYTPCQAAYQVAGASATVDEVTLEFGDLIEGIQNQGAVMGIYGHASTEFSLEEWQAVFDLAQETNQTVSTYSEAMDWLRANDDHVTGNVSYKCSSENESCLSDLVTSYQLQYLSPAIDTGTDVSLTSDYASNPIYGTPDIGAYEYQPPYTIGTNEIDISGDVRIYGDGKFRNTQTASGTTVDLEITPESGSFTTYTSTEVRPVWMNISAPDGQSNIIWTDQTKQWKESSTTLGTSTTKHVIGGLDTSNYYNVYVDDVLGNNITGDNCTAGVCTPNSSGEIIFNYTGGYSEHTFAVTQGDEISSAVSTTTSLDDDLDELEVYDVEYETTEDSIIIKWKTSNNADENIRYGKNREMNHEKEDYHNSKKHKIKIKNLEPDTTYYFRIKSEDRNGQVDRSRIYEVKTDEEEISFFAQPLIQTAEAKIVKKEETKEKIDEKEAKLPDEEAITSRREEKKEEEFDSEEEIEQQEEISWFKRLVNFILGLFR